MTEHGLCASQRHTESVDATTTVEFPAVDSDRVNAYCDECIRHLLLYGVEFAGRSGHEV